MDKTHLKIVPIGEVDTLIVSVVAANLQALMGLNTDVGPKQPKPDYAYQHVRRQFDAGKIIRNLASQDDQIPFLLGMTQYDICTPILTYVFGESQLGGNVALISCHRLAHPETEVTCERAAKIGLHEVSHLLGIGHCRNTGCLMCFSNSLEKLDQLQLEFCDPCRVEISRRLRYRFQAGSTGGLSSCEK